MKWFNTRKCIKCGKYLNIKNFNKGLKTRHYLCDNCYEDMYEKETD